MHFLGSYVGCVVEEERHISCLIDCLQGCMTLIAFISSFHSQCVYARSQDVLTCPLSPKWKYSWRYFATKQIDSQSFLWMNFQYQQLCLWKKGETSYHPAYIMKEYFRFLFGTTVFCTKFVLNRHVIRISFVSQILIRFSVGKRWIQFNYKQLYIFWKDVVLEIL